MISGDFKISHSGQITIRTKNSPTKSGQVTLSTESTDLKPGISSLLVGAQVSVYGGDSTSARGGGISLQGDKSVISTDGLISIRGGNGKLGNGEIVLETSPSDFLSGEISLKTGSSSNSGKMFATTGDSAERSGD